MLDKIFKPKKKEEPSFGRVEPTFSEIELKEVEESIDFDDLIEGNAEDLPFSSRNVVEGLLKLVLEIERKTDLASYDTLFSDDASGRLVTLFLKDLVDYKRRGQGLDSSDTYFLATGRHDEEQIRDAVRDFLSEKKDKVGRALLVTEFINTGGSIEEIASDLLDEGIDFDIASAYTSDRAELSSETERRLFSGKAPYTAFFSKNEMSGVIKGDIANTDEDFFAHPRKSMVVDKEKLKRIREDLHRTSEKIAIALYGKSEKG